MKPFTLITGASSGIGEACAQVVAELGRPLLLTARRLDKLDAVKARIEERLGEKAPLIVTRMVDVCRREDVDRFFEEARNEEWQINVLINNAGLALGKKALGDYEDEELVGMVDTNITGFIRMLIQSYPFLKATKGYCIGLGSIAGKQAYPNGAIYCASKAAVHSAMEGARMDALADEVRYTTLAPGAVSGTEFSSVRFKGDTEKINATYEGYQPLSPSDVAEVVRFLLQLPAHVSIPYLEIFPQAQGSATLLHKKA